MSSKDGAGGAAVLVEETFPSRLDEVERLCAQMRWALKKHHLQEDAFTLELLLREALVNAVVHGNGEDPALKVACRVSLEEDQAVIYVEDQGPGFDWISVSGMDGADAEQGPDGRLEDSSGRGRAIMDQYADSVKYVPPGNRLILKKTIREEKSMSEELKVERDGQKAVVTMTQDLVASRAGTVKSGLKTLVEDGVQELTVDMASVEMVDSAGIGVLVATQNSLKKKDGGLKAVHLNTDLMDLFKTMRLDYHFQVEGD